MAGSHILAAVMPDISRVPIRNPQSAIRTRQSAIQIAAGALDLPQRQAHRAVLLTAIFPFSFFFGVVYSESTFLLFAVLTVFCFRTRRWIAGGLCGAVATATRVPGIMMLPALAWIAWRTA